MNILYDILRMLLAIIVAHFAGKGVSKLKLPAILGWLLTGMVLGPYALNIVNYNLLDASWYKILSHFFECAVGIMLAKELIFRKLKKYGKQILTITLFESLGTFILVSVVFAVLFYYMNIPLYVAFIFGGIALATAPAPSLSIINEFKTKGALTNTLVPIAMLDDIVAIIIFFSINSYVATLGSAASQSVLVVIGLTVLLPIVLGIVIGYFASFLYKKDMSKTLTRWCTIIIIIAVFAIAYIVDNIILATPMINYMLLGMAAFTTVANRVSEEKIEEIVQSVLPLVGLSLMFMILNLGAPLDYHLILDAGLLTAIYIVTRAIGKYCNTYVGAKITHAEPAIKKYLGFTLLPHSGVSLVFTGMAVSTLSNFDSESALIVKGTIAAAAVLNEIIAVIIAKKGFEWAGELNKN